MDAVDLELYWRWLGYAELSELEQAEAELEHLERADCHVAILEGLRWQINWAHGFLAQIDAELRTLTAGARGL